MQSKKPILVIESSGENTAAARHALDDLGIGHSVVSAAMPETLTHLKAQREQTPCVVLLTVDESDEDGLAVLRTIKQDELLRSIPVVVLGPAENRRMIDESFGLGAAGYLAQSPDDPAFAEAMRTLYAYWSLSELPK